MLIRVYPPPQTKTTIRSDHIRLMFALFDKSIWAQLNSDVQSYCLSFDCCPFSIVDLEFSIGPRKPAVSLRMSSRFRTERILCCHATTQPDATRRWRWKATTTTTFEKTWCLHNTHTVVVPGPSSSVLLLALRRSVNGNLGISSSAGVGNNCCTFYWGNWGEWCLVLAYSMRGLFVGG